jgi:DNA repair exonuclease SbcCD ATPase subunit
MASNEVIQALEALRQELDKLEPAIKHVETAQQVTETVKNIPQKHLELLKEVKQNDSKHKDELKDLFSNELTSITSENKKLAKNNEEIQKLIKEDLEIISKLKETVSLFLDRVDRVNFPERLDKIDANVAGIMAAIQSVQSRLDGLERNISDRLKDVMEQQKEMRSSLQTTLEQNKTTLQALLDTSTKKQQTNSYITWGLIVLGIIAIILTCKN